ncbi:MAG: flagellar biosynthetic protein FliR [Deltaproteobacteria bacterium]|nr:flagellar biosynthetic protein FliR [Deltaproteobacteria bacterium]
MDWLLGQWHDFLRVALRTTCLLIFCPVWDSRFIPVQVRVFSLLAVSLALTPMVAPSLPAMPNSWPALAGLVLQEFLLGLSLGLLVRFFLTGAQMAGNLLSVQMGFGMVTLIDPQSGGQSAVIGDLFLFLAILVFLAIDGHHFLLRLLVLSFQEVPAGSPLAWPVNFFLSLPKFGSLMYQMTVMLAAPVLAALFLAQIALGLVARAVPQIQIMIVSFPLTIGLGLLFLSFTLTVLGPALIDHFTALKAPLHQALQAWKG